MTRAEARAAMLAEGTLELWHGRPVLTALGARAVNETLGHLPSLIKIYDVILTHATLTIRGFDDPRSADFTAASVQLTKAPDQFERALAWLQSVPRIATPKAYSYRLAREIDVPNGAFLCACLHLHVPMTRLGNARGAFVGVAK
jgi:hypothetical protein